LDQFSPPSLEMCEFSPFNHILLSLFGVSNAIHGYTCVVYTV